MSTGPMSLRGVAITGFRGVSSDPARAMLLENFGHRNVFIGRNNSGKSTLFRFLSFLCGHVKSGYDFPGLTEAKLSESCFWRHKEKGEFNVVLTFSSPGGEYGAFTSNAPFSFIQDGIWRVELRARRFGDGGPWYLLMSPQVFFDQSWHSFADFSSSAGERKFLSQPPQGYVRIDDNHEFVRTAKSLIQPFKEWVDRLLFFDPVRSLTRAGNKAPNVLDGSKVLEELYALQDDGLAPSLWYHFRQRFLEKMNRLFNPPFNELAVYSKPAPDMSLTIKDAVPIAISEMGSGVSEIVILLAALCRGLKPGTHLFLEEPEPHLHAGLLRGLLAILAEMTDVRFFISSHSNVVLDCLCEHDRVYHFSQTENGACIAKQCVNITDQHHVLDMLGVSGGTLLQTNCVVWVEGPSDRLYVREWLDDLSQGQLKEGVHYSFAWYGGKLLAHVGLDADVEDAGDEDVADLISLTKVCRFSAVLMDRDLPPDESLTKLSQAKTRIVNEAQQDLSHRLACVTNGREIENDLPSVLFLDALAIEAKCDAEKLRGLALTGQERFTREVVTRLGLTGEEQKRTEAKLAKLKVHIAEQVLQLKRSRKDPFSPPQYLRDLYEFIRKSQLEVL